MFKYTKRSDVNPKKHKHTEVVKTFPHLWDSILRSHKRERLQLLKNIEWEEKQNVALSTPLLLKLRDQILCPYIVQTDSNCVALKTPHKDAATNPLIQG